jgi:hypothetical protein
MPMKAVSALQKKAAHPRQTKNNIAKRPVFTVNVHPQQTAYAMALLSIPDPGKRIDSASASKSKGGKARLAGKADNSPPRVASNYYNPLEPLLNRIDHFAIICPGCKPQFR